MYYKVVYGGNCQNELTSARSAIVTYKVGEWIEAPENTRLFVFDNFDDARRFRISGEQIYLCEVEDPVKMRGAFTFEFESFWNMVNKILDSGGKLEESPEYIYWHKSEIEAICVRKVKLVERV